MCNLLARIISSSGDISGQSRNEPDLALNESPQHSKVSDSSKSHEVKYPFYFYSFNMLVVVHTFQSFFQTHS